MFFSEEIRKNLAKMEEIAQKLEEIQRQREIIIEQLNNRKPLTLEDVYRRYGIEMTEEDRMWGALSDEPAG